MLYFTPLIIIIMVPKETIAGLKQGNDSPKQQIAALANEVQSMKNIKLQIAARSTAFAGSRTPPFI